MAGSYLLRLMIAFEHLTYRYPDAAGPVLHDLSFRIEEGEFVLVVGPSGAGKSTLLRCLNGLVPHFYGGAIAGRIRVAGRDPVALGPAGMSDTVGFVFQDPEAQFVIDQVEDELAFALENAGLDPATMRKRVEEVLDQLALAPLRRRSIHTLSGGERQRVAIGAVLTLQPRVLVLDEPTSQLDPQAAEDVLDVLIRLNHDLGLTIVLAEHRLERVVQYVDRVLYMPAPGQPILLDTPATVLNQMDLTPPVVTLGKALGWWPLPLSIKEGRAFARRLKLSPPPGSPPPVTAPDPIIAVRHLDYAYDGSPALADVSLSVRRGEFVALMGRNGAGKTTLLKHLVGLLRPTRGQVTVAGLDTRTAGVEGLIRHVGYVPQDPGALLFAETVQEELDLTLRNHGRPPGDYTTLLTALGLAGLEGRYPRDLSAGERQRVALAAILVAGPDVLLLDEPTRGLDYAQKEALTAFLQAERGRGRTVVMATHDVELVARCADRVVLLGDGQVVVDGPARQVMSESLVFASQVNKLFRDPAFLTVDDVLRAVEASSSTGYNGRRTWRGCV